MVNNIRMLNIYILSKKVLINIDLKLNSFWDINHFVC